MKHVVERLKAQYPDEWYEAHRGGPDTEKFVRRLAWELHQENPLIGLNGKRGNPGDLSDDCVCVREPGQSVDIRTGERVKVMDFIIGAGGDNPQPGWGEVWDPKNIPTPATWVKPQPVGKGEPIPTPVPPPPVPPPTPPGLTRAEVQAMIDAALANVPKYGEKVALQASGGKILCAEEGGPGESHEDFWLTSRDNIGLWESWKLHRGE